VEIIKKKCENYLKKGIPQTMSSSILFRS
jgi:hypothetical protein